MYYFCFANDFKAHFHYLEGTLKAGQQCFVEVVFPSLQQMHPGLTSRIP